MTASAQHIAAIKAEINTRRPELLRLAAKQGGGTVSVALECDTLDLCYRAGRRPEAYYLHGRLRGIPVILNESELKGLS